MMDLYEAQSASKQHQKVLSYTESIKRRTKTIQDNLKFLNSLVGSGELENLGKVGKLYVQSSFDLMMTGDDKSVRKTSLAKDLMSSNDLIVEESNIKGDGSERFIKLTDIPNKGIVNLKMITIEDKGFKFETELMGEYFIDFLGNIYEYDGEKVIFSAERFMKSIIINRHDVRAIKIIDNYIGKDLGILNDKTEVFQGLFKINVYDTHNWRNLTPIQHLFKAIVTTNIMWNPEVNKKYSTFLKTDFNKYQNPNLSKEKGSAEVNIVKGTFFTKPYLVVRIYDQVRYTPYGYSYNTMDTREYREAVRIFADGNAWVMFQDFGDNDWVEVPNDFYYNDWVDNFAGYVNDKAFEGTALGPYYKRSIMNSAKYRDMSIESYTPPIKCFYSYLKNPIVKILEDEGGLEAIAGQVIEYPDILRFSPLVGVLNVEGETAEEILGLSEDQLRRLKESSLISANGILLFKAFFIDEGIEVEHKNVAPLDDPEYNKVIELIANYYYSYGHEGITDYIKMLRKAHDLFTIGATNSIGNSFTHFIKKNPEVVVDQRARFNKRFVEYADVLLDQIDGFRRDFFTFENIEEFTEAYKVMKENQRE